MNKEEKTSLADAPKSIILAVDLIQLLEENQIDTEVAIDALEIVIKDYKKKHIQLSNTNN